MLAPAGDAREEPSCVVNVRHISAEVLPNAFKGNAWRPRLFVFDSFAKIGYNNDMITTLILILAIFAIGMAVPQLLARSLVGPTFRLFAIPGVILHETGHAIACILTGTKIHRIRLFKRDGGDIMHDVPKIPVIGQLLITMAPLVIGMFAIVFLAARIMDIEKLKIGTDIRDFWPFLFSVVGAVKWSHLISWVWIYLILSIGSTMMPSMQDFRNSWFSLLVFVVAIAVIFRLPHLLVPANALAVSLMPSLILICFILLILLLISLLIYLLSGIFGTMR